MKHFTTMTQNSPVNGTAFPLGLEQAGDARCSLDALLLAAFASPAARAVDLGTGCGVVGLGLLLAGKTDTVLGLDLDAEQVRCAGANAANLGLAGQFQAVCWDLALGVPEPEVQSADLVVSNPPWRDSRTERLPRSPHRQRALYGHAATLPLFASSAARCLKPGSRFASVVGAYRLPDLLAALTAAGFTPARLLTVHPRPQAPAVFGLVEARLGSRPRLVVEPPLLLHHAGSSTYTDEARAFCPWLNPG